jgi:predicted transposase YdaD
LIPDACFEARTRIVRVGDAAIHRVTSFAYTPRAMSRNAHDHLIRQTLSQVEHAEGELRTMLPAAIAGAIDFTTLALAPGDFVDDALLDARSDLLFTARLGGEPAFLYLLLEHQSTVDALMPFRVLRYMIKIWERWLADNKGAKKLPVIVPIVLHHSEKGWTAATELSELLNLEPELLAALGPHVPRLSFILDDLSAQSDDALQSRVMTALARCVLWLLRDGRRSEEEILRAFDAWRSVLEQVVRAPNGVRALAVLLRYILEASDIRADELQRKVLALLGEKAKDAMTTAADRIREEGEQRGEQKGRLEGERRVLLRQLTARFGELPAAVLARVNAADLDQLERWADRVLAEKTLDAVLADG